MDDQPFLMYSLTISFNKKRQKWQFIYYVCGRPTFTDVFSDFASALNVRSRSSRSSSSSKSNCNRRFSANNYLASHGAKTFILSLLKTLLHSNVCKPFLNSKTHREHYSHFNSKKSVFCLPRKKRRKTHLSLKECFRRLDLIFLRLPFASDFSPIQSKIYAMSQHDQVSNLSAEDPK